MPAEQLVLLQQFIQPKDGYIVRVETIGGKVIYAMKVFTTGTFNLCPCEVCDLQREEPARSPAANTLGYCPAVPLMTSNHGGLTCATCCKKEKEDRELGPAG